MSGAEEVLTFLRLLWKSPKSRRRWRVLECHCPRCGELAIEVFRTPAASAPLVAVHFGVKTLDMEPGKFVPAGNPTQGSPCERSDGVGPLKRTPRRAGSRV